MNPVELNKEFTKFKELFDCISEAEYCFDEFGVDFSSSISAREVLKLKCFKYNLYDIDELETISSYDKSNALKFCSEVKKRIINEFIESIENYGNNVELHKNFEDFYEIYELIIQTEVIISHFSLPYNWEAEFNQLKFKCLKFDLCDVDEIENLSDVNSDKASKFCSELKTNICNDFIDKILN